MVVVMIMIAVMIVTIPIPCVVPSVFDSIPPNVIRSPAMFALFIQRVSTASRLRTVLSMLMHGMAQLDFRFLDPVLAFLTVIGSRLRGGC